MLQLKYIFYNFFETLSFIILPYNEYFQECHSLVVSNVKLVQLRMCTEQEETISNVVYFLFVRRTEQSHANLRNTLSDSFTLIANQ